MSLRETKPITNWCPQAKPDAVAAAHGPRSARTASATTAIGRRAHGRSARLHVRNPVEASHVGQPPLLRSPEERRGGKPPPPRGVAAC